MSQDEKIAKSYTDNNTINNNTVNKNAKYEELHKTVIVNDRLRPIRMILPIAVIIFIMAVLGVYTVYQRRGIIKNAEQVANQMAEYIASSIANDMEYAKSSIKFAADTISQSMTSETLENPSEVITPMIENSPFDDIEYIRADGMNVMNIGEPFDASDRVYYIEGMKGNTGVWNNFHPKTSEETLMDFYTPLYYEGKISGVITGYIAATTQITPLFETKLYGQEIYGLLVDENDMVICSTMESEYIKDLTLDVFLKNYNITDDQIERIRDTIHNAAEVAACYEDPTKVGRISVATIPGTDWKVVILVPKASFNAIASENTRVSIIAISVISLILLSYAAYVLIRNANRRKEIAKENEKLEEENRAFNEENKRAFMEISAIRDIIASANMGTWRIDLVDGEKPRMYVDPTMKVLLGVSDKDRTPEETYNDWFDNIKPEAVASVIGSVEKMKQGSFDENTYLWNHPSKGERYVRCGGTAKKIEGGYRLGGYHYDVDEVVREDQAKVEMLKKALEEKADYYNTLGKIAGIYNSMHVIDLVEDTVMELSASKEVSSIVNHRQGAAEMMAQVMSALTVDEYRDRALEYTDLTTLADRMQNKKNIADQFIGKNIGWFLAGFISMETDLQGRPTKVVYTTQSIDEVKKKEEKLISRSRTDELTRLLNRRAYEEDIYEQNNIPEDDNCVLVVLDVNGLKGVNDTLGHAAGDELLIGASLCMKESLGAFGSIYRTGGDEFIAVLSCDKEKLKSALTDFDDKMANWKGKKVSSMSVSYGYVSKEEEPTLSVRKLVAIADKRMYEAKSLYYKNSGLDRRGL
ncbi:MAG: sensor domain-containing diguanylate cyclase [Lachnospiraceae bacterium]|nr:sensor domain-containing diguanylate cyclase [Lachnospiraceae bacterium]